MNETEYERVEANNEEEDNGMNTNYLLLIITCICVLSVTGTLFVLLYFKYKTTKLENGSSIGNSINSSKLSKSERIKPVLSSKLSSTVYSVSKSNQDSNQESSKFKDEVKHTNLRFKSVRSRSIEDHETGPPIVKEISDISNLLEPVFGKLDGRMVSEAGKNQDTSVISTVSGPSDLKSDFNDNIQQKTSEQISVVSKLSSDGGMKQTSKPVQSNQLKDIQDEGIIDKATETPQNNEFQRNNEDLSQVMIDPDSEEANDYVSDFMAPFKNKSKFKPSKVSFSAQIQSKPKESTNDALKRLLGHKNGQSLNNKKTSSKSVSSQSSNDADLKTSLKDDDEED